MKSFYICPTCGSNIQIEDIGPRCQKCHSPTCPKCFKECMECGKHVCIKHWSGTMCLNCYRTRKINDGFKEGKPEKWFWHLIRTAGERIGQNEEQKKWYNSQYPEKQNNLNIIIIFIGLLLFSIELFTFGGREYGGYIPLIFGSLAIGLIMWFRYLKIK